MGVRSVLRCPFAGRAPLINGDTYGLQLFVGCCKREVGSAGQGLRGRSYVAVVNLRELATSIDLLITKQPEVADWTVISVDCLFGEMYLGCGVDGGYFKVGGSEAEAIRVSGLGDPGSGERTDLSLNTGDNPLFDGGDY